MRSFILSAIVSACVLLSGCTSRSAPEAAAAAVPSQETTGSITRPSAVVPPANVGQSAPKVVAARGQSNLAGAMPEPLGFASPSGNIGLPVPGSRPALQVAMAMPEMPSAARSAGQIYGHRFRDAKPMNFGRSNPRKLEVHGVDVSRWQGDIDWDRLRTQGANFAYIKATDGGDHLDPMFKTNWRKAKEAGVRRGAYHFFYWCRTAGEQADWFIRNVPREANALPPVIDVEWNGQSACKQRISRAKVLEKIQVFAEKLERHYGRRPIIYTAPDFYRDNLQGELLDYPFWLRSVAAHPSELYPGRKWLFWQYSGSGLTDGVRGKIDLNVFHGSGGEWQNWVASR
ncbi:MULTISPECIES: glycoside hydrolase family 25 protein [Rhizobium]|uniref:GH25 family lysozyme n=1 Tax=Rhizobium rhododendri TaxID=2506430 RepID=A0ABY8INW8_9HYPH|nr:MULTISPECIES: GH25 family lysozyme [Rhizobium]MBO9135107.1 glycoside hydrolase family 25 protein [Rhizobium sp. B209b/85]MBO9170945.1 glycoside hydrolase family 25 protein [Rhizobium sp. L245/93]QXZ97983.1 glycoside hydrolase family 25 protein [Rhizobium sp. B230/85]QYA03860.1 glycoside hydrolase family 25 protein [Rhizobium sp. B21/90]TQX85364.1 glycosyl hydrolase [Rhizobium sp. rho-13.1]